MPVIPIQVLQSLRLLRSPIAGIGLRRVVRQSVNLASMLLYL